MIIMTLTMCRRIFWTVLFCLILNTFLSRQKELCAHLETHNNNKALVNVTFYVQRNSSLVQCAKLCWSFNLCSSVTFSRLSWDCRLNYINDTQFPPFLMESLNDVYLGTEEINSIVQEKRHSCPTSTRLISTKNNASVCLSHDFGNLKNVAIGKPTQQSSVFMGGAKFYGSAAVDDVWSSDAVQDGCFLSNYDTNPWWSVDLEFPHAMLKVAILNRGDCCGDRLYDITVYYGMEITELKIFATYPGPSVGGEVITLTSNEPRIGQFVKIFQTATQYLQICEVGVYVPDV